VPRLIGAGVETTLQAAGVPAGLTEIVAVRQEDFGVLDQPVGDGRIEEDVAQSEKGVLVVMMVERFNCGGLG
jgi:hypothetical protein